MPIQRVMGQIIDKVYTDTDMDFQLGDKVQDAQGRVYVFIRYQNLTGGDGVAGLFVVACDDAYSHHDVTCDSEHADAVESIPYGQLQSAPEDGECAFAQTEGWNRLAITTGGSVSHSDELAVSGATRGILITKASHQGSVGATVATDDGTTLGVGTVRLNM